MTFIKVSFLNILISILKKIKTKEIIEFLNFRILYRLVENLFCLRNKFLSQPNLLFIM